jgi:putative transposase
VYGGNPLIAPVDLSSRLDGSSAENLITHMVRHGLQQLIQLELVTVLCVSRLARRRSRPGTKRTEERLGHRNGYRTRTLTTHMVDIALQIPVDRRSSAYKLRAVSYFPPSWSPDTGWTRPSTS